MSKQVVEKISLVDIWMCDKNKSANVSTVKVDDKHHQHFTLCCFTLWHSDRLFFVCLLRSSSNLYLYPLLATQPSIFLFINFFLKKKEFCVLKLQEYSTYIVFIYFISYILIPPFLWPLYLNKLWYCKSTFSWVQFTYLVTCCPNFCTLF